MNPRIVSRIGSAALLCLLLGVAMRLENVNRGEKGKEKFIEAQASRFERHYAMPDSLALNMATAAVMLGLTVGAYELLAFGISKALKKREHVDIKS